MKRLLKTDSNGVAAVAEECTSGSRAARLPIVSKPPPRKTQKKTKPQVVVDLSSFVETKHNKVVEMDLVDKKPPPTPKENKHTNTKVTPTPKNNKRGRKPLVDFNLDADRKKKREESDREWDRWEQATLTQLYPPTLPLPPANEEDDWLTQARI